MDGSEDDEPSRPPLERQYGTHETNSSSSSLLAGSHTQASDHVDSISYAPTLADSPSTQAGQAQDDLGNSDFRLLSGSVHSHEANEPAMTLVEKDSDDVSIPVSLYKRQRSTTGTTLNRLFAATYISPGESSNLPPGVPLTPHAPIATPSLPDHLHTRGFIDGRYSDVTLHAFGCSYRLHRLILDRATFFSSAFSGPWLESTSKSIQLRPEEIDPNITQTSFELAIKRLYGINIQAEQSANALSLFATACWLEMPELVNSSTETILRQVGTGTLAPLIRLMTDSYYGKAGHKLLAAAKALLCRSGSKMPLCHWNDIPADVVREICGSDAFYVPSEWHRFVLARRLFNRRLRTAAAEAGLVYPGTKTPLKAPGHASLMAVRFDSAYRKTTATRPSDSLARWVAIYTNPNVEPLLVLLDEGIHYAHLDLEQLQWIRNAKDVFRLALLPEAVVSNALWMQMDIRRKVLNAREEDLELGFSQLPDNNAASLTANQSWPNGEQYAAVPSNSWDGNGKPRRFWIPSSDRNSIMGYTDPILGTSTVRPSPLPTTLRPEDLLWAADFGSTTSEVQAWQAPRPDSSSSTQSVDASPLRFTNVPPFRFSVEVTNPYMSTEEKKRSYSKTFSYAGSFWNIYVQVVKSSKTPQLGVYLHRINSASTFDQNSSVDDRILRLEHELSMRSPGRRKARTRPRVLRQPRGDQVDEPGERLDGESSGTGDNERSSADMNDSSRRSVAAGDFSKSSQVDPDSTHHDRFQPSLNQNSSDYDEEYDGLESEAADIDQLCGSSVPTLARYVDGRTTIKSYFKIYSPSRHGRSLCVYESAPDKFNFSQSWGWKSSQLMLDDFGTHGSEVLAGDGSGRTASESSSLSGGGGDSESRRDAKLRFMVVIGVV